MAMVSADFTNLNINFFGINSPNKTNVMNQIQHIKFSKLMHLNLGDNNISSL